MNIIGYKTFQQSGIGDIGLLDNRDPPIGRFHLSGAFVPLSVRCKFTGTALTAAMSAYLDHGDDTDYHRHLLKTIGTVGANANAAWLLTESELPGYVVAPRGDEKLGYPQLVIDWDNPEAEAMRWELTVVLGRLGGA